MNVKDYLNQVYCLEENIKFDFEEIKNLRDLSQRISSYNFDEKFNRTQDNDPPFVKNVIKITELEEKIKSEIDELIVIRTEVHQVIKKVENLQERKLLWYRYICYLKWYEIEKKMKLGRSTVTRLHQKALQSVERDLQHTKMNHCCTKMSLGEPK